VLLGEPEELGAGVDDAVVAHEAEVGISTPLALHRPDARLMISGDFVSRANSSP
jgi:hypothetical protein